MSAASFAEEPAARGFRNLSAEQRYYWLDGAIITVSHMAGMRDKKQGDCIAAWYLDDIEGKQKLIELKLTQYPEIRSPTSIILGLLTKACGPLVSPQRQ